MNEISRFVRNSPVRLSAVKASLEDIAEAEKIMGIGFPDDYREFLLEVNGQPIPDGTDEEGLCFGMWFHDLENMLECRQQIDWQHLQYLQQQDYVGNYIDSNSALAGRTIYSRSWIPVASNYTGEYFIFYAWDETVTHPVVFSVTEGFVHRRLLANSFTKLLQAINDILEDKKMPWVDSPSNYSAPNL